MGEVSNRLCQNKGVPTKTKTDFRSFCLATMMWVHHLGPTSIKEFKVSYLLTYFRRVQTWIYGNTEPCHSCLNVCTGPGMERQGYRGRCSHCKADPLHTPN